jgi:hypothetical protein
LQADLKLFDGVVDGADRLHAVSAKIVSCVVQVFAGMAKRRNGIANFWMRLRGGGRCAGLRFRGRRRSGSRQGKRQCENEYDDRERTQNSETNVSSDSPRVLICRSSGRWNRGAGIRAASAWA